MQEAKAERGSEYKDILLCVLGVLGVLCGFKFNISDRTNSPQRQQATARP